MSLAMPLRSPITQGPGPVRRSTRLAGNPTPDSTPRAATRRARAPIDTTPPRNHTAHRAAKEQRRPAPPANNKRKSPEDDKRVVKKRKENTTRSVKPTPRASTNRYATRSAPCRASSPLVEDSEKISTVHVQSVPIAPINELPVVDVDIHLQTAPTPRVHAEEPTVCVLPDTQEELDVVIALAPAAREDETDAQLQSSSASAYVTYTDLSPSPASPPAHTTGLESSTEPTPAFGNDAMDLDTADFVMGPVPSSSRLPLADAPMPISMGTDLGAGQFDHVPSLQCASASPPPTEPTLDLDLDAPDFSSASLMTTDPQSHQTLSEHQSEHDMRQREYEAAERARKRASQRQDRLWLAWAGGRVAAMVSRYGMDEVRRIEWARARAGASSSSAGAEFEMYTPHSERDREDFEWDCDEYDEDEDDDEDEVEDIVPEPNFEFLPSPAPAPSSPPPVASHNSTLTVAHTYPDASYSRGSASPAPTTPPARRESVRGTPPFLERRQAWGGTNLIVRSLLPSAALQRPRPPPLSLDDPMEGCGGRLRLTYPGESMEEHHHPSPAMSVPSNAPAEAADATDPSESFADPAIMQAIIASMNNNSGAAHGHGSLSPPSSPSHQDVEYAPSQQTFGGWGVPSPSSPPPSSSPSSPAVGEWSFGAMGAGMGMGGMGMGMEAGWYSSSSTLHSALG